MIDSGFPWDPLGGHFADLGLPYLLHGLNDGFVIAGDWKSCQDRMLGCVVNVENTNVFDRFCFFDFFMNFEFSALDFNDFWDAFWSPGELLAAGWL